jgi:integrase
MSTWTSEQSREFLEHAGTDPLFAAWALFLCRGLRRGEVAGLRWEDLDLDLGRMRIVHTRVVGADNKALPSTPKTDQGRRNIPLDGQLVRTLQKHQVHQKEQRLAVGESWGATGYVFVNELGEPFHPDHFSARFQTIAEDLGLPKIRLHDARHTAASLMLANGTPTKVAQEILGHARPSITQDMYQHVMPGMAEEAGEALSASLLG